MIPLLAESWTWYSVAAVVLIMRYVSRWLQLKSIKRFQVDDYVMLLVFAFYSVLVSCLNIVAHTDTNLMPPEEVPLLTPASIESRVYGSKMVLVVEQSMITVTWGCKVCVLLMYNKMTYGLKQQLIVKCLAVYVCLSWIVMESLYFGVWCRPFREYWAVPTDNVQCSAAIHHLIINAVFNMSSDILMLCIPLPLLLRIQLPVMRKVILCGLFSMGVFVIICAILNKYYSFAHPLSPTWTFWYIREASTAVLVANMPMCWALLRRLFNLHSFINSSHHSSNMMGSGRKGGSAVPKTAPQSVASSTRNAEREWWERDSRLMGSSEDLVPPSTQSRAVPLEIWESREFEVQGDKRNSSLASNAERGMYDGVSNSGPSVTTIVSARHSESSETSRK